MKSLVEVDCVTHPVTNEIVFVVSINGGPQNRQTIVVTMEAFRKYNSTSGRFEWDLMNTILEFLDKVRDGK